MDIASLGYFFLGGTDGYANFAFKKSWIKPRYWPDNGAGGTNFASALEILKEKNIFKKAISGEVHPCVHFHEYV